MALPAVGDGQQVWDGNLNEQLNVGRGTQAVRVGGSTSGTLGFYGTTPVAQRTTTVGAAVATTAAVSTTSNIWGFSTSTQANNLVSMVNSIYGALTSLGFIST